jgi:hypothetical protein
MDAIKPLLVIGGLVAATLLIGYLLRRYERKHWQPLDETQIKNLQATVEDMRKSRDDISR